MNSLSTLRPNLIQCTTEIEAESRLHAAISRRDRIASRLLLAVLVPVKIKLRKTKPTIPARSMGRLKKLTPISS